jgi:hypothetical protein
MAMTVEQLANTEGFEPIVISDKDREILGGYVGDLLSWVMGRAKEGDAWITIMSNANTVAVCTLADPACIVLAEGVEPEPDMLRRAKEQGINVIATKLDSFSASVRIAALI